MSETLAVGDRVKIHHGEMRGPNGALVAIAPYGGRQGIVTGVMPSDYGDRETVSLILDGDGRRVVLDSSRLDRQ
jgi:hypothetical protein